eukprot:4734984-Amphidinium_carterae.1
MSSFCMASSALCGSPAGARADDKVRKSPFSVALTKADSSSKTAWAIDSKLLTTAVMFPPLLARPTTFARPSSKDSSQAWAVRT